ncbi:MAG: hypothetical protein KKC84_07085 [Candidatus Omnitrophica bacterium]|nr:hypothetical protein [Candidatus Omnitrophota bacterium]
MHEVFRLGKNIADVMNETFKKIEKGEGTLGKLIFDETLYNELEAAVKHRQGTIGRFLYDDSIYKKVEELVQDADGLISDIRRHPWKLFWKTKEKKPKK